MMPVLVDGERLRCRIINIVKALLKIILAIVTPVIKLIGILLFISAFNTWISYEYYPDYAAFSPRGVFPLFSEIGVVFNWVLVCIQATLGIYCWKIDDYITFGIEEAEPTRQKPTKKYPY